MSRKALFVTAISALILLVIPLSSFSSCPKFSSALAAGVLQDGDITEVSGIAASTLNPGVFWIHEDSGSRPVIYAVTIDGELVASCTLPTAKALDWEDIAIGTDEKGESCIYVADIGDNRFDRKEINVYRIPEPRLDPHDNGREIVIEDIEGFRFVYPDRPHDAETLLFDPLFKEIYVITKWEARSRIYRARPEQPGVTTTLEYVSNLPFSGATGGDVSADGASIIIRTYFAAYIWRRDPARPLWEAAIQQGCQVNLATEPQGEAICFTPDGDLITISEGKHPTIYRYTPLSP